MAKQTQKATESNIVSLGIRQLSTLVNRLNLAMRGATGFSGARDYYATFGYSTRLRFEDYLLKYTRQDVAGRIIDAPADSIWNQPPTITSKKTNLWGNKWQNITQQSQLWDAFRKADKLAGLGQYSVILLGFDDVSNELGMEREVKGSPKLLFVQPYSEISAEILELDSDITSPRFGLPLTYRIKTFDPADQVLNQRNTPKMKAANRDIKVHYSRVVHIVENNLENKIYGLPRLHRVYNLLEDLLKVVGGSSEIFWLSGRQGLHLDIDKDMQLEPGDTEALADEVEEYQHQLRRVLRTRGVEAKVLESSTVDPRGSFEVLISLISGATGIPKRILLGSEAGQLASEQDRANWAERIQERRGAFAVPNVILPTIKALTNAKLLTPVELNELVIDWPSAFIMSPLEAAQMMAQKARAAINLAKQANKGNVPITTIEEAREILLIPRVPLSSDTPFAVDRSPSSNNPREPIPNPEDIDNPSTTD